MDQSVRSLHENYPHLTPFIKRISDRGIHGECILLDEFCYFDIKSLVPLIAVKTATIIGMSTPTDKWTDLLIKISESE